MIPAIVVFCYLAVVLYIGIFAFRKGKQTREDFFVASRSLTPYIFLLALFGTNMTAFSILGSSGAAYQRGVGIFGQLASSSALIIPLTFLLIGTRLWAVGKQHGYITQVQFLRERFECGGTGTLIFALTAAMLVPYIIIGVIGGGKTLEAISGGKVPYWFGGALVAVVVMSYVFFGGMRGTAWVNTFQTIMFLCFGTIAFILIGKALGGYSGVMEKLASDPKTLPLLTRERIAPQEFFSYMFIPLSSIMFPHVAIMCMTAEKVSAFKKTIIFYPICILVLWLPSVFLGVVAASQFPGLRPGESDDVLLRLLNANTSVVLAGVLGAAIMAAVMATDSQILALCTMFTNDLVRFYKGATMSDQAQVWWGRAFVVIVTAAAYFIALALKDKEGIFNLAIRFAFSGFSALAPIMLAAMYWKRATKWGVFSAAVWVVIALIFTFWLHEHTMKIAPGPGQPPVQVFPGLGNLFLRTPGGVTHFGYLSVVPMTLIAGLILWVVSLFTAPPSAATIAKFFPSPQQGRRAALGQESALSARAKT
ncbi:MAG TPA: sodium:solute symporter family protein [Methylomirabilota bacterium]|nr:sodium:solute symporter family protein [Methylomirabilota bacterium]